MICSTCADKGIVRIWEDSDEFALCLCPASRWYRSDVNAGQHTGHFGWQVWCARHRIDPAKVFLLEEVMTPEGLTEAGFTSPSAPAAVQREAALLGAGKSRKVKL